MLKRVAKLEAPRLYLPNPAAMEKPESPVELIIQILETIALTPKPQIVFPVKVGEDQETSTRSRTGLHIQALLLAESIDRETWEKLTLETQNNLTSKLGMKLCRSFTSYQRNLAPVIALKEKLIQEMHETTKLLLSQLCPSRDVFYTLSVIPTISIPRALSECAPVDLVGGLFKECGRLNPEWAPQSFREALSNYLSENMGPLFPDAKTLRDNLAHYQLLLQHPNIPTERKLHALTLFPAPPQDLACTPGTVKRIREAIESLTDHPDKTTVKDHAKERIIQILREERVRHLGDQVHIEEAVACEMQTPNGRQQSPDKVAQRQWISYSNMVKVQRAFRMGVEGRIDECMDALLEWVCTGKEDSCNERIIDFQPQLRARATLHSTRLLSLEVNLYDSLDVVQTLLVKQDEWNLHASYSASHTEDDELGFDDQKEEAEPNFSNTDESYWDDKTQELLAWTHREFIKDRPFQEGPLWLIAKIKYWNELPLQEAKAGYLKLFENLGKLRLRLAPCYQARIDIIRDNLCHQIASVFLGLGNLPYFYIFDGLAQQTLARGPLASKSHLDLAKGDLTTPRATHVATIKGSLLLAAKTGDTPRVTGLLERTVEFDILNLDDLCELHWQTRPSNFQNCKTTIEPYIVRKLQVFSASELNQFIERYPSLAHLVPAEHFVQLSFKSWASQFCRALSDPSEAGQTKQASLSDSTFLTLKILEVVRASKSVVLAKAEDTFLASLPYHLIIEANPALAIELLFLPQTQKQIPDVRLTTQHHHVYSPQGYFLFNHSYDLLALLKESSLSTRPAEMRDLLLRFLMSPARFSRHSETTVLTEIATRYSALLPRLLCAFPEHTPILLEVLLPQLPSQDIANQVLFDTLRLIADTNINEAVRLALTPFKSTNGMTFRQFNTPDFMKKLYVNCTDSDLKAKLATHMIYKKTLIQAGVIVDLEAEKRKQAFLEQEKREKEQALLSKVNLQESQLRFSGKPTLRLKPPAAPKPPTPWDT